MIDDGLNSPSVQNAVSVCINQGIHVDVSQIKQAAGLNKLPGIGLRPFQGGLGQFQIGLQRGVDLLCTVGNEKTGHVGDGGDGPAVFRLDAHIIQMSIGEQIGSAQIAGKIEEIRGISGGDGDGTPVEGIETLGQIFRPSDGRGPAQAIVDVIILSPEIQDAVEVGGDFHHRVGDHPPGTQGTEPGAGGGCGGGGQLLPQSAALQGGGDGPMPPAADGIQPILCFVDIGVLGTQQEQASQHQYGGDCCQCRQPGALDGALPGHGPGQQEQDQSSEQTEQGQSVRGCVGDHHGGHKWRQGQDHRQGAAAAADHGTDGGKDNDAAPAGQQQVQGYGLPLHPGESHRTPAIAAVVDDGDPGNEGPQGQGKAADAPQPENRGKGAGEGLGAAGQREQDASAHSTEGPDTHQSAGGFHRQVKGSDQAINGTPAQSQGNGQGSGGSDQLTLHRLHLRYGTARRLRGPGPGGCPQRQWDGRAGRPWQKSVRFRW